MKLTVVQRYVAVTKKHVLDRRILTELLSKLLQRHCN
jgi:hypothetical protein